MLYYSDFVLIVYFLFLFVFLFRELHLQWLNEIVWIFGDFCRQMLCLLISKLNVSVSLFRFAFSHPFYSEFWLFAFWWVWSLLCSLSHLSNLRSIYVVPKCCVLFFELLKDAFLLTWKLDSFYLCCKLICTFDVLVSCHLELANCLINAYKPITINELFFC